jgi:hypothetical protein
VGNIIKATNWVKKHADFKSLYGRRISRPIENIIEGTLDDANLDEQTLDGDAKTTDR